MNKGLSKARLYSIFSGMKQRCYNQNNSHYKWYGAKGITICDEWLGNNGLQNFISWSLEHGYNENLSIDRIDSDKGYSPDNCQWGSQTLNSMRVSNPSRTVQEKQNGSFTYESNEQIVMEIKKLMLEKKVSQRDIAEKLNITPQGLTKILNKKNFGFEDAQKILTAMGYELIVDFKEGEAYETQLK